MNLSMIENLTNLIFMSLVLSAIPLMTVKTLLTTMASEQFSSGPGPKPLTPGTISSGLYLNPPPCVDLQVPTVIAPYALSTSTSQTNQETPSLVIPLGVEEANHDIKVAHMDNNPYVDFPITELSSEESSTRVVIPNIVHSVNQPPEHINKWTKDHPLDNVKFDELGGVLKNKARLVAMGYRQEEGIDFEESFAPIA
ncbi:hypothetical protein Tco_0599327 [Tanacetum coccineum]